MADKITDNSQKPEQDCAEMTYFCDINQNLKMTYGRVWWEYILTNPTITFRQWLKENRGYSDEEITKRFPNIDQEA